MNDQTARLARVRQHNTARLAKVDPANLANAYEEIAAEDLGALCAQSRVEKPEDAALVAETAASLAGARLGKFVNVLAVNVRRLLELAPAATPTSPARSADETPPRTSTK